jgi:8-amino-7-oxononanoate synthase
VSAGSAGWVEWIEQQCEQIMAAGQWREPKAFDAAGPVGRLIARDETVVSFASNDYLGLTQHPRVRAAAVAAIDRWGTGSGASRLVVGSRPIHADLEIELADWKGTERSVLFPTGFAANTGVLAVLADPNTVVCSDELNHASIIDGCAAARGRGADVQVYRHVDVDHLATLLAGLDRRRRVIVVTDTVFSMDGDVAPLDAIADLCRRHGALLVVDDAHAVFDTGADLSGLVSVRVGTLSKTLGSLGGYVAGPGALVDLVVNRARPFIFTTAPTPADTAAASAALKVVRSPEGDALRHRLHSHIETVKPEHPSPIIPVVVGGEQAALDASAALLARGMWVPAIRPPTVAPGTSRLRVALCAAHTDAQVATLCVALDELGLNP